MPLLPFYSRPKINRDPLVTAALAEKHQPLTCEGSSWEGTKQTKLQDLRFLLAWEWFSKTVSYPKLLPVSFESFPSGLWPLSQRRWEGPPVTGNHSSSRPPILAARANTGALRITAKDTHRGQRGASFVEKSKTSMLEGHWLHRGSHRHYFSKVNWKNRRFSSWPSLALG